MEFTLSGPQRSARLAVQALARTLPSDAGAADAIAAIARAGLIGAHTDALTATVVVDSLAGESASAAIALAFHAGVVLGLGAGSRVAGLGDGSRIGAVALSTERVPEVRGSRLTGVASWVAPLTGGGVAVVGARQGPDLIAAAVALDSPGVSIDEVPTAALRGVRCGHVACADAACEVVGPPQPFMALVRVLLAAAGLGMGQRAVDIALKAAHGYRGRGAGGEQTVQGLLADAATELEAARVLVWKAASAPHLALADASMAKLAATEAAQGAVLRATQVVGADSFRAGHPIERLAQDVRALELFAGRTEALREAAAEAVLRGLA
jgi:alkylation response protein AidB-like acyl-CoA dehydrogenase